MKFINKLTLSIFFFIYIFTVKVHGANTYGNEWLVNDQQYFKIQIWETGFYRINYSLLSASKVPLNTFLPQNIQLFFRGNQQSVFVNDLNNNNSFDDGDYIEFYAQKNDGFLDKNLYTPTSAHLNPYYNLFSDTSSYFITASAVGPYNRINKSASITDGITSSNATVSILEVLSNNYKNGVRSNEFSNDFAVDSRFSYADGWCGDPTTTKNHTFTITNANTINPKGKIEVIVNNYNSKDQILQITVSNENGITEILGTTPSISGYQNYTFTDSITNNLIFNGNKVIVNITTQSSAYFNPVSIKLTYNQKLNSNITKFTTDSLTHSNLLFKLNTFPYNPTVYDITDSSNIDIISSEIVNNQLTFGLLQSNIEKNIYIRDTSYFTPKSLDFIKVLPKYKTLTKYASSDSIYIIVSDESLMKSTSQYANPIRSYSDYRASNAGGKFDTLLVTFKDLCNNYNYGEFSPLALKQFLQYMCKDPNHIPDYLFLIGKGLSIDFDNYGLYRKIAPSEKKYSNLIPPMGNPGSDLLYSAGLANLNENIPAIATGRFSAVSEIDVANYLDKITVSESQSPDALWNKQLLHLSGGRGEDQIITFRSRMNYWKSIAESDYWGAKVTSYSKTTLNSTQVFDVSKEVNAGLKLLTFYGHSGLDGTDVTIGDVNDPVYNYNNKDKYPMMILNGCLAGNVFDITSFGESWMNAGNKGAIAFLGHTGEGFTGSLYYYTTNWYLKQFADSIYCNKSIGDIHKVVSTDFINTYTDLEYVAQAQQMLLQGDPAFVLFKSTETDYQIADNQLAIKSLDNKTITAISDSFQIKMLVKNLGKTDLYKNYIKVRITRTLPDGSTIQYAPKSYPPIYFQDTLRFTIYSAGVNSFGNNSFFVEIDYDNKIFEINETNNTARINIFLQQSGVTCLFPREFSIVNTTKTNLIAQSTDLLSTEKVYVFEVDTAWTFNSPFKKTKEIIGISLPTYTDFELLPNQDSLVYYWRVRYRDLSANLDTIYGTSSFMYIDGGNPGWAQAQFPQFFKNTDSQGINRNITTRKWEFTKNNLILDIKTQVNDYTKAKLVANGVNYIANGNQKHYWENTPNGILALAFKKSTIESYTFFSDYLVSRGTVTLFVRGSNTNGFCEDNFYSDTTDNRYSYAKAYLDSVKSGDYVVFFTSGNANIGKWTGGLKNKLIQQGAQKISYLKNNYPYILLYKKDVGVVAEISADTSNDELAKNTLISLDDTISIQYNQGTVTSTKIGPASTWKQLYRKVGTDHTTDAWKFTIHGYTLNNQKDSLWSGVPIHGMDISTLIDSTKYTYITLTASLSDTTGNNPTPPQINNWIITYGNNIPEGVLSVNTIDSPIIMNKNYIEGEKLKVTYEFTNITNIDFKSPLVVQYVIKSLNSNQTKIEYDTINSVLESQKSITKTHYFDTQGFVGDINFQIFVNPYSQREEYYTNNVLVIAGKVIRNTFNPLLEVTFDGSKIMDGDIVSPSPLVNITVSDFNKYLRKSDTSGIKILIKKDNCSSCSYEQIPMNSPEIRFIPEGNNNKYHIEYKPKALSDGRYMLSVQASDANGLESGVNPYQVRFEVINKSTVTNFYPYPNPFTDHTRFVFTLTGTEIPDEIKITIMTVSGIIVKEIFQNEIGPIRIGNNITQYAWDGKDQFGDKLANGVYLYRVTINNHGSKVENRASGGDQAFKNNMGKIVILR